MNGGSDLCIGERHQRLEPPMEGPLASHLAVAIVLLGEDQATMERLLQAVHLSSVRRNSLHLLVQPAALSWCSSVPTGTRATIVVPRPDAEVIDNSPLTICTRSLMLISPSPWPCRIPRWSRPTPRSTTMSWILSSRFAPVRALRSDGGPCSRVLPPPVYAR